MKAFSLYPFGFGAASISGEGGGYGFGKVSEKEAVDLLLASYESGFRVFDSAPIYGFGMSEKRLGKAFSSRGSSMLEDVFIISKSGVSWDKNKRVDKDNSKATTLKMLDQSLKDLNRDYIDLYMVHWPDPRHDICSALDVLMKAKEEKKILHIGLCNLSLEDWNKVESYPIEAFQDTWNLFSWNTSYEKYKNLNPKIPLMAYGTLDKGILSGRLSLNRSFDSADARSRAPWWKAQDLAKKLKLVDGLKVILDERGLSLLNFCLSFSKNYKNHFIQLPLIGLKSIDDLKSFQKESEALLSELQLQEIINELETFGYRPEDTYEK